jgi:HAD superfamily hydrolase (TIGR01509 family)
MSHRLEGSQSFVRPRQPLRAVVFDMDGLMFNTEDVYTKVGDEVLRRRSKQFTLDLKKAMMGLQPRPAFETMIRWHDLCDTAEELMAESNAVFLGILRDHIELMPGLLSLLTALETADVPKAIATSSCRELTDACLAAFNLAPRFRFSLTAEDIARGKPHPDIYLTAAERLGVAPTATMVLEDSENGCRAARAAGAFTVAVPGEHSQSHDFSTANLVAETLADWRIYEALELPPPA